MGVLFLTGEVATLTDTLTSSFSSVGTDLLSMVGKVAPIAIPVIGAVIVVNVGVKVFKRITGKI